VIYFAQSALSSCEFAADGLPKVKRVPDAEILDNGSARIEEEKLILPENSSWKTRLVERGFPDRSFGIEFWQELGDEAIFAAAWEMVELAEEAQGRKPAPQKVVTTPKQI
jgi:hypothetical protein